MEPEPRETPDQGSTSRATKMKRKAYEREMRALQGELVAMQEWVKASGARICVVFEGVDSAGKGGTIRRITERTSPRVFKHIALPAPDDRVKSQMYVQRYMAHFPAAGEVVIFDRSWYNRAGVEPVLGYCTQKQTERFLRMVPQVEKAMVDDGIILIKYFLNVSREEQTRRLESRIDDPRKIWKLSPTDLKSYGTGMATSGPAMRCSSRPVPSGRRGISWVTTTRSAVGSTSSPTCSARYPTSRSRLERKNAEAAEPGWIRRTGIVAAEHLHAVLVNMGSGEHIRNEDNWYAMAPEEVSTRLGVPDLAGRTARLHHRVLRFMCR